MGESAVLHRSIHQTPKRVVTAKGSWLTLEDGRQILDATSGAAVACIGHGDSRVSDAIVKQMAEVSYCHSSFFGTSSSECLAQELVGSTGREMKKALFLNSGSEAMEAALKLARQYFLELDPPQPERAHFIARAPSYHGNTLGALAVSGHKARRGKYEPMLMRNTSHVSAAYEYRGQRATESIEEYVSRLVAELDSEFNRLGPQNVCAFVAEPVVGAAMGCVTAPPGYFAAVKRVCEQHGALLILDEVMCGIGRTGTMHAWQHPEVGVTPDLQTMGKGLGGGYVPVSALLVGQKVCDALHGGSGSFAHMQTYQSHSMICAAAAAVQKVIKEDDLLSNVKTMGEKLSESLFEALGQHPHVGNIRGRGLFWGLEIVRDRATKQPFPSALNVAERISERALNFEEAFGMTLYPGSGTADGREGDHVLLTPPYNITEEDVDLIVRVTKKAIDDVTSKIANYESND